MKSKLSLRNLAKTGLLFKITFLFLLALSGCTSSTSPTFLVKDIPQAIRDICKKEYKIDVVVTQLGKTLWVYLPVEEMFVEEKSDKKFKEKFSILENKGGFKDGLFKFDYEIKPIPETEKPQEYNYNKKVQEKMRNVWRALQRVIFSLERENDGQPEFFCLVTTDTKSGLEIIEEIYALDLKKVAYGLISWEEYGHRTPTQTTLALDALGDTEGKHLKYREIAMGDFIVDQVMHRVQLKFQKPEVKEGADIDKEMLRIAVTTLKIYGFKDFSTLELSNVPTKKKTILNRVAVEANPID